MDIINLVKAKPETIVNIIKNFEWDIKEVKKRLDDLERGYRMLLHMKNDLEKSYVLDLDDYKHKERP